MEPTLTIFVCSTYSDLVEERRAAIHAIKQLQLKHGSMEFFGARANQPIETCLDEVRQSNIIVVIVGHRYGTVIPGQQISFSEAEYTEGYGLGKPCLVYIRDEDVAVLPRHFEREPDKLLRLDKWKVVLRDRHTVASFKGSADLAAHISEDLNRVIEDLEKKARFQGVLGPVRDLIRRNADVSPRELLRPFSLAINDYLNTRLVATEQRYRKSQAKRIYYLSMEFLMGRWLTDSLCNLRLDEQCRSELAELGVSLEEVLKAEPDAGLGSGNLGELAASILESTATLGMPCLGYGIDYEYGFFKQEIVAGYQRETSDLWKSEGTSFYNDHPDESCIIPFYGHIEHGRDSEGNRRARWVGARILIGRPHDLPVAGFGGETVNHLRLFSAHAARAFDIEMFNKGDYMGAVAERVFSENISRVLYPSDSVPSGRELRLGQEYFLVACALRDIIRQYRSTDNSFDNFPSKTAIHLNDTHPSLCVAELMRLLVDEYQCDWDESWEITRATLSYTSRTPLQEALEKWPVSLMERVLPRHLEIIFGINHQCLRAVARRWPGDTDKRRRMSMIEEEPEKQVRMMHLAIVGSHAVSGVSKLHTEALKTELVPEFAALWPERFNSKTVGVTPRRWILKANPGLASLLTRTVGERWITDLEQLRQLEEQASDPAFQAEFLDVRRRNKSALAQEILNRTGSVIDPDSLFDVHVKLVDRRRRQLLNVMRIIHEYLTIVEDGIDPQVSRTHIFAGKALSDDWTAKQIIKLINNIAQVINNSAPVKGRIKVVFVPDYGVSIAEIIIPAADISQQISIVGGEASGTSNIKLAMNGALTVGTLDAMNLEIMEAVGAPNIYTFGLTADDVHWYREHQVYNPRELYETFPQVKRVMDNLTTDRFCPQEAGLFRWIGHELMDGGDPYFHLADLSAYIEASICAECDYQNPSLWASKAILNVARMGCFSSDRVVREYAKDIWNINPVF